MKPLNRPERNYTFLRFVFFFLITVAVVVAVVLFSVEVPVKETKQLHQTMVAMRNEKEFSDSFSNVMKDAMNELDKFDTDNGFVTSTKQNVQFKINEMNALLKTAPGGQNSIYALIVRNIGDLNEAKARLKSLEKNPNQ